MKLIIPVKMVPDLVEELTIDDSGTALDKSWLRLIINEFDDHAIEQAILLKERFGGDITIISPDVEGVDDLLFTAAAKGVDRLVKMIGDFEGEVNNHALARALVPILQEIQPDLVLTGVQAHNDLDGSLGPLLAEYMGIPYIGYVTGVNLQDGKAIVNKEYPGGLIAEMEVVLPAILGIQAAEQPPRYVAISKVRQVMKTTNIEENTVEMLDPSGAPTISRLYLPEASEQATMLSEDPDQASEQILAIIKDMGLL
jgi:electron transfer flavoprotein beta subunit